MSYWGENEKVQRIKAKIPVRSYCGGKWRTNRTNKKYLAKDFEHRCAYCDDWDHYNGGERSYHVEHFAPKEKFPALEYVYDNLLYACPYCNEAKSDKWPSDRPEISVVGNEGFLDPCTEEYYKYIYRREDGSIGYNGELGKYIYNALNLYLKRHQVNYNLVRVNEKIKELEEIIQRKQEKGKETGQLEKLYHHLLAEFRYRVNELGCL